MDIIQAAIGWLELLLELLQYRNSPGTFMLFSMRNGLVFLTGKILLYLQQQTLQASFCQLQLLQGQFGRHHVYQALFRVVMLSPSYTNQYCIKQGGPAKSKLLLLRQKCCSIRFKHVMIVISPYIIVMSNKLMRAVHQKYKRSNSKSDLRNKGSNNNASKEQSGKVEAVFTSAKVNGLIETFKKQVQTPIHLHTQIFQAKNPQKCLQHNNISTLYCLKDERLLCAGCMYQTPIHKGHKVIPVTQAADNMKQDVKHRVGVIEDCLKVSRKCIDQAVKNLEKAEREYPQLMEELHNFFMHLHQLLIDRKNQQLQFLTETWSKLRYENYAMKAELTRICDYVEYKLKDVAEHQSEEDLTFNKNIVDHLSRIGDIIDEEFVKEEQNNFFKEIARFKVVTQFADDNLILTEVKNKIIHSLYLGENKGLRKSLSKTSIKRSSSNIKIHQKNASKMEKSAEEILIEMHLGEQLSDQSKKSPKNRHSMNQVTMLKELADKKKAFDISKIKDKRFTPVKSQREVIKKPIVSPRSPKRQKSPPSKSPLGKKK